MTILRELVRFSETIDLPAQGYAESVVYYEITLNLDGSFKRIRSLETSVKDREGNPKKPRIGQKLSCPHIRRNAIQAKLITDTAEYIFGTGNKTQAYLKLLENCYQLTQEAAVKAILIFLESSPLKNIPGLKEIEAKQVITFRINGMDDLVHNLRPVQKFWAHYVDEITGSDRQKMQCLATGKMASVTTKFSLPIKGVPGTTTQGGSLISAYSSACSSYKLSGALVSPISAIADEQFSQALNYLLREDRHHLTIGNITYVFWSDSEKINAKFFESPDDPSVKDYLNLIHQPDNPIHPESQIHILALTGNSGRLVVRDWMEIKELDFAKNYQTWLTNQEIIGWNNVEERGHLNIWQLARSTVRDSKELLPRTINAFFRNAVYEESLPMSLIQNVCHQNRTERDVNYFRAVVLNQFIDDQKRKKIMITTQEKIAFEYGRLLAVYAQLQRQAQHKKITLPNTNAMKYYASVGYYPVMMSHRLASAATNHMTALARHPNKKLLSLFLGKVSEIKSKISELSQKTRIPSIFSPECQAEFDLGFWHEIQYTRQAIKEIELANETHYSPMAKQNKQDNYTLISQEAR